MIDASGVTSSERSKDWVADAREISEQQDGWNECHDEDDDAIDLENNGLLWLPSEPEDLLEEKHNINGDNKLEDCRPSLSDHQSILVAFSTRCVWRGTVCERSDLFQIKYFGDSDKTLGRFLRDHLLDQGYRCRSCDMPAEAHVQSYIYHQGTLTVSVKKLPEMDLPGEIEGKIWMWQRCLRCPKVNGFPPSTRRIVMSDAALSLSFGKFLELSFLNHNRVPSCGHSLHRDCLRFYGFGKMVACFCYASINVHSVYLPPSKLVYNNDNQDRIQRGVNEVSDSVQWDKSSVGINDTVIPIYDDEATSIISYAMSSPGYISQLSEHEKLKTEHAKVTFSDNGPSGEVKYTVTCYFAQQFEALRRICCPSEMDFIRSLSCCNKWGDEGGKSNVFTKTLDDRFVIKQVTKAEHKSFIKFAPSYFEYVTHSIDTESPTCLAKILGMYQVTSKHLKGGKEWKMDVVVIENVMFARKLTRLYDLKGSTESRYNSDPSGKNKVLLDQNLIEAMPTSPICVGNKAKRLLERAVWNDTSFLASIDVMDYSLLVGVDEEKNELLVGIINFTRQYTWDKHIETWVKASGILGRPKNASPTVISPKEYKKRFRKAMATYFLMVPDQTDICEKNEVEH